MRLEHQQFISLLCPSVALLGSDYAFRDARNVSLSETKPISGLSPADSKAAKQALSNLSSWFARIDHIQECFECFKEDKTLLDALESQEVALGIDAPTDEEPPGLAPWLVAAVTGGMDVTFESLKESENAVPVRVESTPSQCLENATRLVELERQRLLAIMRGLIAESFEPTGAQRTVLRAYQTCVLNNVTRYEKQREVRGVQTCAVRSEDPITSCIHLPLAHTLSLLLADSVTYAGSEEGPREGGQGEEDARGEREEGPAGEPEQTKGDEKRPHACSRLGRGGRAGRGGHQACLHRRSRARHGGRAG